MKYAKKAMRKAFEINNKSEPESNKIVFNLSEDGYAIIKPENNPNSCSPLQPLLISTALDPTIEIIRLSVLTR